MSGLRIDAGANRPVGPSRPGAASKSTASSASATTTAAGPATFGATTFGRLREIMERANGPVTSSQQDELQAELDRLRDELASAGQPSTEVQAALDHLSVASQNVAASRSRLSDIDAARAAAQLAKEQIRSQMPAAIQAQANAAARSTRDLLGE